jgi:hypothetical protein
MTRKRHNARVRKAIERELKTSPDSYRSIAKAHGVTHPYVIKLHKQMGLFNPNKPRVGQDGKLHHHAGHVPPEPPPRYPAPQINVGGAVGDEIRKTNRSAIDLLRSLRVLKKMGENHGFKGDIRENIASTIGELKKVLKVFP